MNSKIASVASLLESCIEFRVAVSFFEMAQVFKLYGATGKFPYNGMPMNMSEIVGDIEKAVGITQYPQINGKANPNTGGTGHARAQIGNEYSLVIYVRIVKAYPLNKTETQVKQDLAAIAKKYFADEYHVEDCEGSFEVRMWWD